MIDTTRDNGGDESAAERQVTPETALTRQLAPILRDQAANPKYEFEDPTPEQCAQFYRLWRYANQVPDLYTEINPLVQDCGQPIHLVTRYLAEASPPEGCEQFSQTAEAGRFFVIRMVEAAQLLLRAHDRAFHALWCEAVGRGDKEVDTWLNED